MFDPTTVSDTVTKVYFKDFCEMNPVGSSLLYFERRSEGMSHDEALNTPADRAVKRLHE
jgi:hypothetical protein